MAAGFMEPITLAAHFGFWGRIAASADDRAGGATALPSVVHAPHSAIRAAALLDEAVPTAEHDLAAWIAGTDPWRDTFALWLLTDEPHAVGRLRDLIFSLATRWGGLTARSGGIVRGSRHPFHDQLLVSASAQLALGGCGAAGSTRR